MPYVDDDQNVFDPHALQERKKLLTATFFVAIIISLRHICRLLCFVVVVWFIGVLFNIWTRGDSVGNDTALSLSDATLASNIVQNQVDMSLIADCSRKGLEFRAAHVLLLAKTDRIEYTLHFLHHWNHVCWELRDRFVLLMVFNLLIIILLEWNDLVVLIECLLILLTSSGARCCIIFFDSHGTLRWSIIVLEVDMRPTWHIHTFILVLLRHEELLTVFTHEGLLLLDLLQSYFTGALWRTHCALTLCHDSNK